ncbi:unnamed protein product [Arctogadus glacialis]
MTKKTSGCPTRGETDGHPQPKEQGAQDRETQRGEVPTLSPGRDHPPLQAVGRTPEKTPASANQDQGGKRALLELEWVKKLICPLIPMQPLRSEHWLISAGDGGISTPSPSVAALGSRLTEAL